MLCLQNGQSEKTTIAPFIILFSAFLACDMRPKVINSHLKQKPSLKTLLKAVNILHVNDVNDSIGAADGKLQTRAFLRSASSRIEKKFAIVFHKAVLPAQPVRFICTLF